MANLWHDAVKLAAETATQLRRDGKKTTEYRGDDGKKIQAWILEHLGSHSETRSPGTAYFEEYWDRSVLVLGNDGKIYRYSEHSTEYGSGTAGGYRVETVKRLRLAERRELLGKGKPFSNLTTLLERLPYT